MASEKEVLREWLQASLLRNMRAVCTDQWQRAYMRAYPHKSMELLARLQPQQVIGGGENGAVEVTVVHSIARSALDELPTPHQPRVIEHTPDDSTSG